MSVLLEIPLLILIDISCITLLLFFYHISFPIGKAMGINKLFRLFIYYSLILSVISSIGTLVLAQFSKYAPIGLPYTMILRIIAMFLGILGVHKHFSWAIIQCIILKHESKK